MQNTFVSYKSLLVLGLSCYKARVTEKGGGVSLGFTRNPYLSFSSKPEVGIYKRKQESKKKRKQELDQESDQEKKSSSCFLVITLVEFSFSCFLTFLFSFINSHLRKIFILSVRYMYGRL